VPNLLGHLEVVGVRRGNQLREGDSYFARKPFKVITWLIGRVGRSPQADDLSYVTVALAPVSLLLSHGDATRISLSVLIERLSHRTDTIS
jgi:hypothetical protein